MNVCIIGSGWYGCYVAEYIIDKFKDINITILEKNNDIFDGSSYKNQNRLHNGFHYPRCKITRDKCIKYYNKFINKYPDIVTPINNNYYIISKTSKIKYNDYIKLYDKNSYTILNNNIFTNVDRNILNVNESFINFYKAKEYFKNKLKDKVKIINNFEVINLIQNDNNIIINNDYRYKFDKVFNCTYNQLNYNNNKSFMFEKCLTLVYEKINQNIDFDTLTIMDGNYSSLYTYKDNLFTLTDVLNTPLIKHYDFNIVKDSNNYTIDNHTLLSYISKFEDNICYYYPTFKHNFKYNDYYISYKCKNINNDLDTRDININIDNNIINIWCGKISFIFDIDNYLNKIFIKSISKDI